MGAAHGFELGDVFAHDPQSPTDKDELVLRAISTYWTNFAKTGNPNGPGLAQWPAFTREHQSVMNLGDPIMASEISSKDLRRLELLDAFYAQRRQSVVAHH
jgi:para-nitrobenzyl esterase